MVLPATVRTLAALESHLGVRLCNRTTRRISLTEEGRRHLESCKQLLFGQMHVGPAVTRFVQHHTQMRCSVVRLVRVVNLLEEGIDLGLRIGQLEDSALVAQPGGNIRRMVVASPAFLSRHGTPAHPGDLLKTNCVRMSDHGPAWGRSMTGAGGFGWPSVVIWSSTRTQRRSMPVRQEWVSGLLCLTRWRRL